MKKYLLFAAILVFLFSGSNFSQTLDSIDTASFKDEPKYTEDALNRLYIVGLQYMTEGNLTQAEISFRSILAFPFRSKDWRVVRFYKGKSHFYLGDIYFIQKKYNQAIEQYKAVAQEYTEIEEYTSSLFKLGRSYILSGNTKDGIEILRTYSFNYGGQDGLADNTLYWIARGYLSEENYPAALRTLEQILSEYPDSAMSYDVRILIAQLKTDSYQNKNPDTQYAINSSQEKALAIESKKELIVRIENILQLKERLLLVKEKKLELLEKISSIRAKAISNRQAFAAKDGNSP